MNGHPITPNGSIDGTRERTRGSALHGEALAGHGGSMMSGFGTCFEELHEDRRVM
jgi:hypothetical protein